MAKRSRDMDTDTYSFTQDTKLPILEVQGGVPSFGPNFVCREAPLKNIRIREDKALPKNAAELSTINILTHDFERVYGQLQAFRNNESKNIWEIFYQKRILDFIEISENSETMIKFKISAPRATPDNSTPEPPPVELILPQTEQGGKYENFTVFKYKAPFPHDYISVGEIQAEYLKNFLAALKQPASNLEITFKSFCQGYTQSCEPNISVPSTHLQTYIATCNSKILTAALDAQAQIFPESYNKAFVELDSLLSKSAATTSNMTRYGRFLVDIGAGEGCTAFLKQQRDCIQKAIEQYAQYKTKKSPTEADCWALLSKGAYSNKKGETNFMPGLWFNKGEQTVFQFFKVIPENAPHTEVKSVETYGNQLSQSRNYAIVALPKDRIEVLSHSVNVIVAEDDETAQPLSSVTDTSVGEERLSETTGHRVYNLPGFDAKGPTTVAAKQDAGDAAVYSFANVASIFDTAANGVAHDDVVQSCGDALAYACGWETDETGVQQSLTTWLSAILQESPTEQNNQFDGSNIAFAVQRRDPDDVQFVHAQSDEALVTQDMCYGAAGSTVAQPHATLQKGYQAGATNYRVDLVTGKVTQCVALEESAPASTYGVDFAADDAELTSEQNSELIKQFAALHAPYVTFDNDGVVDALSDGEDLYSDSADDSHDSDSDSVDYEANIEHDTTLYASRPASTTQPPPMLVYGIASVDAPTAPTLRVASLATPSATAAAAIDVHEKVDDYKNEFDEQQSDAPVIKVDAADVDAVGVLDLSEETEQDDADVFDALETDEIDAIDFDDGELSDDNALQLDNVEDEFDSAETYGKERDFDDDDDSIALDEHVSDDEDAFAEFDF